MYYELIRLIFEDMGLEDVTFHSFDYHLPFDLLRLFKGISNNKSYGEVFSALLRAGVRNRLLDDVDEQLNYYRAFEVEKGATQDIADQLFQEIIDTKRRSKLRKLQKSIPSRFEGTPKSLLEAMYNNIPAIGSDVNGINNILTDNKNGFLF